MINCPVIIGNVSTLTQASNLAGQSFQPSGQTQRFIVGENSGLTAASFDITSTTSYPDSTLLDYIIRDVGISNSTLGFKTSSGNTGNSYYTKSYNLNPLWYYDTTSSYVHDTRAIAETWFSNTSSNLRNYFYFPDTSRLIISEYFGSVSSNYKVYEYSNGVIGSQLTENFYFQMGGTGGRIGIKLLVYSDNSFWIVSVGDNNYYRRTQLSSSISSILLDTFETIQTYPITYQYTNSTVSGPSEAPIGDTVTVSAVPDNNYGITDPATQILVTNNDIPVSYNWNPSTNTITFVMPDPT